MGKRPAESELFVGNMSSIQREDTAFYAKRRTASHGNRTRTNSSKFAVNRFLKSVVREIRTLRCVGAGGGQPPLATRCLGVRFPWATRPGHISRGRNAGYPAPPTQTRTCGFPASGSSVALASARIFTVTRYKIQLLFPAVRLARVYPALHVRHEFPLRAACFRQVLPLVSAPLIQHKVVWLAFPTSEYYA